MIPKNGRFLAKMGGLEYLKKAVKVQTSGGSWVPPCQKTGMLIMKPKIITLKNVPNLLSFATPKYTPLVLKHPPNPVKQCK